MLWDIHKLNMVRRIAQKCGPAVQRLEDTGLPFDAEVITQPIACSHETHQTFRLMGVQLIRDKDPDCLGVRVDGLGNVGRKIGFRTGWPQAWGYTPPRGDLEIGHQAQGAMADVFELTPFRLPWLHGLGRRTPFERLNPGHFVTTDHPYPHGGKQHHIGIERTDGAHLLGKDDRISGFGLGVEPVATEMWEQRGLILKNERRIGGKYG